MDASNPKVAKKSSSRRKYTRVGTDQVISFAPVDARDVFGLGRDVSRGGIRFEAVGCEFDLGEVLRITFNIADRTVVAVGRVAWATELDPLTTDVGVEFIQIDSDVSDLLEEIAPSDVAV